jgi:hypothetical protein
VNGDRREQNWIGVDQPASRVLFDRHEALGRCPRHADWTKAPADCKRCPIGWAGVWRAVTTWDPNRPLIPWIRTCIRNELNAARRETNDGLGYRFKNQDGTRGWLAWSTNPHSPRETRGRARPTPGWEAAERRAARTDPDFGIGVSREFKAEDADRQRTWFSQREDYFYREGQHDPTADEAIENITRQQLRESCYPYVRRAFNAVYSWATPAKRRVLALLLDTEDVDVLHERFSVPHRVIKNVLRDLADEEEMRRAWEIYVARTEGGDD